MKIDHVQITNEQNKKETMRYYDDNAVCVSWLKAQVPCVRVQCTFRMKAEKRQKAGANLFELALLCQTPAACNHPAPTNPQLLCGWTLLPFPQIHEFHSNIIVQPRTCTMSIHLPTISLLYIYHYFTLETHLTFSFVNLPLYEYTYIRTFFHFISLHTRRRFSRQPTVCIRYSMTTFPLMTIPLLICSKSHQCFALQCPSQRSFMKYGFKRVAKDYYTGLLLGYARCSSSALSFYIYNTNICGWNFRQCLWIIIHIIICAI